MTHNGSRLDDAPDLAEHFARALGTEPPFELPLGDALDAAVLGGRRRRVRARAARTLTAAACAAVVVGGVTVAGTQLPAATDHGVMAGAGGADVAPATGPAPASEVTAAQLEALGTAIASKGAAAKTLTRQDSAVTVEFTGSTGTYDLTVSVVSEPFDAEATAKACSPSNVDSKPCRVVSSTSDAVALSFDYTDRSGRSVLSYQADAGDRATVQVWFDNYTEQQSGDKVVGPTWKQAGVTPEHIRSVLAEAADWGSS